MIREAQEWFKEFIIQNLMQTNKIKQYQLYHWYIPRLIITWPLHCTVLPVLHWKLYVTFVTQIIMHLNLLG